VIKAGHKWSIGTGTPIPLWDRNWLYDGSSIDKPTHLDPFLNNLTVSDCLLLNSKAMEYGVVARPCQCRVGLIEAVKDKKCGWKFEHNGLYYVKSAYR
jgi:hypothetical protein